MKSLKVKEYIWLLPESLKYTQVMQIWGVQIKIMTCNM